MAFRVQLLLAPNYEVVSDNGAFEAVDDAYDAADEVGCRLVNLNATDVVAITNDRGTVIYFDGSREARLAFFRAVVQKG